MIKTLLMTLGLAPSVSEAERLVKQGAVEIDGQRIDDPRKEVDLSKPTRFSFARRKEKIRPRGCGISPTRIAMYDRALRQNFTNHLRHLSRNRRRRRQPRRINSHQVNHLRRIHIALNHKIRHGMLGTRRHQFRP